MVIDCSVYADGRKPEDQPSAHDALRVCKSTGGFVWMGLYEPDMEELDDARRAFDLHELAVEDAVNAHQRPKLETYGDSLFMVLKTARYLDTEHRLEIGEILLFVGEHFIVSVRHGEASQLYGVQRLMERRPHMLRLGPSAVLYGILDQVVDDYWKVADELERQIESEVEAEVLLPNGHCTPEQIYMLKRQVLELHMATAPLEEPLERLWRRRPELVHPEIAVHIRDVHDHMLKVVQAEHRFREVLSNAMDLHLSTTSARLNVSVHRLTVIASIFLPLTFLTGFFGMNFGWLVGSIAPPAAFGVGIGVMLGVLAAQVVWFRRGGYLS
jgi:magnesium transporter